MWSNGNHVNPKEVLIQLAAVIAKTKRKMCKHTARQIHTAYMTQIQCDKGRRKACPLITKNLCCPIYLGMSNVDLVSSDTTTFHSPERLHSRKNRSSGLRHWTWRLPIENEKRLYRKGMSLILSRPFCPPQLLICTALRSKERKQGKSLALYPSPIATIVPVI